MNGRGAAGLMLRMALASEDPDDRPTIAPKMNTRMALPELRSISWWHLIVELERNGYTHAAIAAAIGGARTTVQGWKNAEAEPRHIDGERLIALWRVVTGRVREDLPVKTSEILSAASFK